MSTRDNNILQLRNIKKYFPVGRRFLKANQWLKAVDTLRANELEVMTYLLFKPPFMSEGDSLKHCIEWIREVGTLSDEVSVNPMNIKRGTIVERLYRHREYRPPRLWALVEMIRQGDSGPGR